jgi:hypothetical protein
MKIKYQKQITEKKELETPDLNLTDCYFSVIQLCFEELH